jgi:hypothetical protein
VIAELTSQISQVQNQTTADKYAVAALKKGLDIQKQIGQAAVALIEGAVAAAPEGVGANIDIYA